MKLGWTLALVAALGSAARGRQNDEMEKLRKAAEKEKQDELKGLPERVGKLERSQFKLGEGLKFRSEDGNFDASITGRFYFIYRHIFDRADAGATNPDTFAVDTARLMFDGTFYKDYFARIEMEFSKGGGSSSGTKDDRRFFLKDGYIGWKGVEDLSLTMGQYKQPFSQEETCSSRFIDFAERSIINFLVPAHEIGFMGKGKLFEGMAEWELSVFNGSNILGAGAGRNEPDTSDEKEIAARFRGTPFKSSDMGWLKGLRLGVAGVVGDVDNVTGTTLKDVDTGDLGKLKVIDYGGVAEDGLRTRLGFELSWAYRSWGLRAEYILVNQELTTDEDFDTTGFYVSGSWILTGEEKVQENRIKPAKPFSIKDGTWGAIELAARIAVLDASDAEGAGALASTTNQEVTQITFGVNWWLHNSFRVTLNWEHLEFDEEIAQGSDTIDDEDVLYWRFQVDF